MFHSYVSLPDVYANFSSTKIHPKKQENFKKKTTHLAKNTMEGVKSS